VDNLREIFAWGMANYIGVFTCLGLLLAFLESLVALTPTKTDDGFVKRLGGWIDGARRLVRVPSIKREDGSLMPTGIHKP